MFVDRFMSTAMHYPCNYGYVPQTLSDDGDPVDVLVITPFPLVARRRRHVPADRRAEDGGRGRRRRQAAGRADRQDPADLHALAEARGHATSCACSQIQHFFEHYKDLEPGKWVKVGGWEGPGCGARRGPQRHRELRRGEGASAGPDAARRRFSRRGFGSGLERAALVQLVEVALDAGAFALEEVVDRVARTADARASAPTRSAPAAGRAPSCARPARRPRSGGSRCAMHHCERLVVAGLEVQAVDVLERAPVAAEGASCARGSIAISDAAMRLPPRQAMNSSQLRGHRRAPCARRSRASGRASSGARGR